MANKLCPLQAFRIANQLLIKNSGRPIFLCWYISNTHAKEGAVVGVIVSAVILPIFKLSQVLQ